MEKFAAATSDSHPRGAADRLKPALFLVATLAALSLGFWLVSPEVADGLVRHLGYWFLLATVALFITSLWRLGREKRPLQVNRRVCLPLAATLAGGAFLLLHEPFMFKVVADEAVLAATSFHIHLYREILSPTMAHDLGGDFSLFRGYLDKRPYFFPFLVSLLHDFTGYRPQNAFILNGLLVFLLMGLAWIWGSRTAGNRGGGLVVLLLAGLPLLATSATSGGFDLLNLVMILACALLAASFLEKRTDASMSAFCIGVVLLAQTRYESVLFVLACGAVIAVAWIRERRIFLTWPVVLAPILMLPYVWQNRAFRQNEQFWQLPDGLETPFSLAYAGQNLGHAFNFLADLSLLQPNSVWLTLIGGMGVVGSGVILLCRRKLMKDDFRLPYAVFGAVILFNFLLLLCYHWGQIDDYVASRLALPLHLLFAMGAVQFLSLANVSRPIWNTAFAICFASILGYTVPANANHSGVRRYANGQEVEWARSYIRANGHTQTLYVMGYPSAGMIERAPTICHETARMFLRGEPALPEFGRYQQILVTQRISYDSLTGAVEIQEDQDLGSSVLLEPLAERRLGASAGIRISRLIYPARLTRDSDQRTEGQET